MKKITLALLLSASTIHAAGMFSIGHKNFGFSISQDSAYGNSYTVMGASANYFLVDNISTGLAYQTWLGDEPSINQITVPVTYHIPLNSTYRPYIGAFYSHTFMGDDGVHEYNDYDSYGGRVGLTMQTSSNSYVSFGWVQEVYDDGVNSESRGYPQVSGGFSF
ncbi:MAG: hypothetical protein K0U38_10780 [Epsilonproteobacteria bacterium]|nr:hypothetical protein [Campylobacterota bacterium]